jgi:hypothetical protein
MGSRLFYGTMVLVLVSGIGGAAALTAGQHDPVVQER